MPDWKNKLYYGDNLEVLRRHVADESVDLVYLDPPFKSNQDYNVLFQERTGTPAAAQIKAFKDTWRWDMAAAEAYEEVVERGPTRVSQVMQGFRTSIGTNDVLAYLSMMAPRLVELRRVLKSSGSIYLHCDPAASHYLKLLMDAVFDARNFKNEIIWRRTGAHGGSRRFAPLHQTILFYAKSNTFKWTKPKKPYMRGHVAQYLVQDAKGYRTNYYGNVLTGSGRRGGESGKPWRGIDPSAKGRHWAIPGALLDEIDEDLSGLSQHEKLDRLYELGYIKIEPDQAWPIYEHYVDPSVGSAISDIWAFQPYTEGTVFGTELGVDADVRWLSPTDQERLDYPTQKPEGLLARILTASTEEDDLVLDPFCGCGTTVAVAQRLGRRWVGIDITQAAIVVIKQRLEDRLGLKVSTDYEVIGEPVSVPDAEALAAEDPYQFQWWALGLVGARPTEEKKGADEGIDGRVYFHDEAGGKTKQIILSVKAGKPKVDHLRALAGVVEREGAAIGVLILMQEPTSAMRKDAASAGFYHSPGWDRDYPKIQIVTVAELLAGRGIDFPPGERRTFKKARRASPGGPETPGLPFAGEK